MLSCLFHKGARAVASGAPRDVCRAAFVFFAVAFLSQSSIVAVGAQEASAEAHRRLLDRYCTTCHNQDRQVAGLMLDRIDLDRVDENAETLEKVLHKLRTRSMPPPGRQRPEPRLYAEFAWWLGAELDRASVANPNPGRPASHRLNRTEYQNAVRDLLAIEIDSQELLPADDAGFGFDNIADTLSFSPLLLERYLAAATTISRLAVGDLEILPAIEIYKVSPLQVPTDRLSEDLPFGSAGGMVVDHYFPLDAEYVIRVTLQRSRARESRRLDVRLDGARLDLFELASGFSQSPDAEKPRDLEVRFNAKAGQRSVGVSFLKRTAALEGTGPSWLPPGSISVTAGGHELGVSRVEIDGPYQVTGRGDTPSRRRIFVCRPQEVDDEEGCARTILSTLARRAYRRPAADEDVEILLDFYRAGRSQGDFDTGVQWAVERILVDPEFLFRIERDPEGIGAGEVYRLSDLELASRLSFFLWSTIPDDALLELAEDNLLRDPEVLQGQVERLLQDERSRALVSNFAAQWLFLRNLKTLERDVNIYPEFDDNLRDAFRRETEMFLSSQLREDRSVLDLLFADYTFVNERLARHYGMEDVYGSRFRRVTYPDDSRGGLLGQGSILAVTSYANRTSPVLRGKWLLENILGAPPPPPPADVPELPKKGEGAAASSVRARLEQHRADPACATCHDRIDPLGFALENFDGVGRWRTVDENGVPIDARSELPDGTRLDGPAELRALLFSRREEFLSTFTRKLLTYALGRGIEFYDLPAVRAILSEAAKDDYAWSSVIMGIVRSTPFQMRRSES